MNAAILLAQRGHRVSLYEKGDDLGGLCSIASARPWKKDYTVYTEYLKQSLDKSGVPVRLSTNSHKRVC